MMGMPTEGQKVICILKQAPKTFWRFYF